MAEGITLDVIDRPQAGAAKTIKRARELQERPPDGAVACIAMRTGRFWPRPFPRPTPRRMALLTSWRSVDGIDAGWSRSLAPFAEGAREHWHVRGEITRASFSTPWLGWTPDVEGAARLGDDEPALIIIAGELMGKAVPSFFSDLAKCVEQSRPQPGYLGGLALIFSSLSSLSCSAWASYADAKQYAYTDGAHLRTLQRERERPRHNSQWFLRIRPLEERGSLEGAARFAPVLEQRRAVAA